MGPCGAGGLQGPRWRLILGSLEMRLSECDTQRPQSTLAHSRVPVSSSHSLRTQSRKKG